MDNKRFISFNKKYETPKYVKESNDKKFDNNKDNAMFLMSPEFRIHHIKT